MKQIIKDTYPKYGINITLKKLGLSKDSQRYVFSQIYKMGLKRVNKYFSKEEIEYLKNNYSIKSVSEIASYLHKDKNIIYAKVSKLGLSNDIYFYSDEDIDYLKCNYGILSTETICRHLNKSYIAVVAKANKLGLCIIERWTEDEILTLKKVYPYYTNRKIVKDYFPNKNTYSIVAEAQRLNLSKSKEKGVKWYDKEDIILQLKDVANKLKRTPYGYELVNFGLPSSKTFERYFGSYRKACIEAGIEPNYQLFGKSIHCKSINGVECASKSEKIVCDYLELHNIQYIKEPFYKDYINDSRCKSKRFDWKVKDYFIEFFGMPEKNYYSKRMLEKIQICNDHKIKLISLYKSDLKNLDIKLHILLQQNP